MTKSRRATAGETKIKLPTRSCHTDCQHPLGIRIQTLDVLWKAESVVAMEDTRRETPTASQRITKDRDEECQQVERALQNLQP